MDQRHKWSRETSITSETSTVSFRSADRTITSSKCSRFRQNLSIFLHTHVILIVVSALVALDAVCVIGQLIGDILIAKVELHELEMHTEDAASLLEELFPSLFNSTTYGAMAFGNILNILKGINDDILEEYRNKMFPASLIVGRSKRDVVFFSGEFQDNSIGHDLLHDISHLFHLVSITLLSILMLETLFKVFAMGCGVMQHKIEAFDVFVITVSWSLDVIFYRGLWAHPGTEAVTILVFMLPWRVIRIVNSFVLLIQEKDRVTLKIVKQQSRGTLRRGDGFKRKVDCYKAEVDKLRSMCKGFGALEKELEACQGRPHQTYRLSFLRRFSAPSTNPLQSKDVEEYSSEDEAVWSGNSGEDQSGHDQESSSISSECPPPTEKTECITSSTPVANDTKLETLNSRTTTMIHRSENDTNESSHNSKELRISGKLGKECETEAETSQADIIINGAFRHLYSDVSDLSVERIDVEEVPSINEEVHEEDVGTRL